MKMVERWRTLLLACSLALVGCLPLCAEPNWSPEQLEFFEAKVRPVLADHCYECHNSTEQAEGGVAVDFRGGLVAGGDAEPLIVPGKPAESRLLPILRHEIPGLEMPQGGPALQPAVLADLEKWIAMGAPDPRDRPPGAEELATSTSWEAVFERRQQWWSFQPIEASLPPAVQRQGWQTHPVDRFVEAARADAGLRPVAPADPAVLVRRLFFNLLGLPPQPEESEAWAGRIAAASGDKRDAVVEALIDDLLGRPQFGERWARHWMDWIRYAESHGSEGDPRIENAWQYRDYLIRALNNDVPYDQLLREHVAGDLLSEPRVNHDLGINESIIGTAHWRMVFHGFAPTDALDEKVRFTDDQINAFSKAFLGLTVSCARCHNHKFDAISQADYYALFGVLASCRPARKVIDLPAQVNRHRTEMQFSKPAIRRAVAEDWLQGLSGLRPRLDALTATTPDADQVPPLLSTLAKVRQAAAQGKAFDQAWQDEQHRVQAAENEAFQAGTPRHWDLRDRETYAAWFSEGAGLPSAPQPAGTFAIAATGERALEGIYPAGVYSHALSSKHPARLTSPDVDLDEESELWVRVRGAGEASLRYVVHDYPRRGTVYPVKRLDAPWRWERFDLSYWTGDTVHVELAAAKDAPLLTANRPRSWFGVQQAAIVPLGQGAPREVALSDRLLAAHADAAAPTDWEGGAAAIEAVIAQAIRDWRDGKANDFQAELLDACQRQGLLPHRLDALPTAKPLIEAYRRLEADVPVPTRVVGLDESQGRDQPLLIRGDHKQPGDPVPRRFLSAIDPSPYESPRSGRRQLAEDLVRDDNPLTRRVIVNRLWHHLFGRGLVRTPDNFGRLGDEPTHPELLDWLAVQLKEEGWSLKKMIRLITTSRTWQLSSRPSPTAQQQDPENRWLSHANVRRLEAEAIRDAMLQVSGRLDERLYGASVPGTTPRRSLYVQVIRNALDPFLRAFDFPEPFSAVGRRDATNVPAQSLTMMNAPRVRADAAAWARQTMASTGQDEDPRSGIQQMFRTALGRPAGDAELDQLVAYWRETAAAERERRRKVSMLREQLAALRDQRHAQLAPIRQRLEAEQGELQTAAEALLDEIPPPIAFWNFDTNADDQKGGADARLVGEARLQEGALVLNGNGYAVSQPLTNPLTTKTLEVWVELSNLEQRGGGAITIQTPDGLHFDSLVFGEKTPRHWLAGSNNFRRTQSFGGDPEREATQGPVHIALVYHGDGRISGYRQGQPYGQPYASSGPHPFAAGQSVVTFGLRHLPAGGNRFLQGRIYQAKLYDRALDAAQVAVAAKAHPTFVSEADLLAQLNEEKRETLEEMDRQASVWERELKTLQPSGEERVDVAVWTDLARVLFMLKEFIYVR